MDKPKYIIYLFGFISGFNLLITGNSLNFWLAKEGLNIKIIGLFSLVTLPYAVNFLWAPIIDHFSPFYFGKRLGKRIGWGVILLIGAAITSFILSLLDPVENASLIALVSFSTAIFTSSTDMVLGALRTEILKPNQHGYAAGIYIIGYRLGMMVSGSFAIYLSSLISWENIYKLFALTMIGFAFLFYRATRNLSAELSALLPSHEKLKLSKQFIIGSVLSSIGNKNFISLLLVFLILYRLPDNLISTMVNAFVLHLGFDELQIATLGKFWGIIGSILGGALASKILKTLPIYDGILRFGFIHALTHLSYLALQITGQNVATLFVVTGLESITGGMTMTVYIALITSLCKGKYRATQYAFLTSMMGISRSIIPSFSGIIVVNYGWNHFFTITSIIALLTLFFVPYLKKKANIEAQE